MAARDTSAEATMVRTALYRRMTSDQRSELVVEMSQATREIALDNIRRRHPAYSDHQARMALYRLLLGDELFRRVWPSEQSLAACRQWALATCSARSSELSIRSESGTWSLARSRAPHMASRAVRAISISSSIRPAQLDELLAELPAEQYYVDRDVARDALRRRSMFNVIEIETAWKLDFMIRKARPFSMEELRRSQKTTILGLEVVAASPEDTVIAKLEWGKLAASDRQLEDAAGVLRVCGATIDFAYIEHWTTELGLVDEWQRTRAKV